MLIPPNSVMVDVETGGPNPDVNPIIQIGAVAFDESLNEVRRFCMCIEVPAGREWHPDTREWWLKTDPDLLKEIEFNAVSYDVAMREFLHFLPEGAWLWAWPTTFDIPFIRSYAESYGREFAMAFNDKVCRVSMDCRSWIYGRLGRWLGKGELDEFTAEARRRLNARGVIIREHNGLHDALWQIECLKLANDTARLEKVLR